jgi:hypothetical protein
MSYSAIADMCVREVGVIYRRLRPGDTPTPGGNVYHYRWYHIPTKTTGVETVETFSGHFTDLLDHWNQFYWMWVYKSIPTRDTPPAHPRYTECVP